MRFPYKDLPITKGGADWWAVLRVQLSNPAKHSPPCRKFEAMIDSGAAICIFHSDVANAIGLRIAQGELSETIGISGAKTAIYLHNVSLHVPGGFMFKIRAGFTDEVPIAGLLGRIGFFEHFKITFDPSSIPPGFDLERFYRA